MSKDLLELARKKRQQQANGKQPEPKKEVKTNAKKETLKKTRILSVSPNDIATIHMVEGNREVEVHYNHMDTCMGCGKERLLCSETDCCIVCDQVASEEDYKKQFPSKPVADKKEVPKQPIQGKTLLPITSKNGLSDDLLEKYSKNLGISKEDFKERYDKIKERFGGLMSIEGMITVIKKDLEKESQPKVEFPDSLKPFKERVLKIIESTGLSLKEVIQKILDKTTELEGKMDIEGVLSLVERELGLREEVIDAKTEEIVEEITTEEPKEKAIPVNQEVTTFIIEEQPEKEEKKPITTKKEKETAIKVAEVTSTDIVKKESPTEALIPHRLPTIKEIAQYIQRYDYVKKTIVNKSDFVDIKGKEYLKKSGWRKFINAFGLSIVLVSKRTYEAFGDKHCEVIVRAIAPSGQFVEGIGIKSWKELATPSIHNLEATAWTRAVNRAVSDLVAFGEVSAEEMIGKGNETVEFLDE